MTESSKKAAHKEAKKQRAAKTPGKKRAIIALPIVAILVIGGVLGVLWAGGVFDKNGKTAPVDFLSTFASMETENSHELVAAYQGGDGSIHLIYKTGALKKMFVDLLTTPVLVTDLNSGGGVTFTKGTVESSSISKGVSRSVTTSSEHMQGVSVTVQVGTGDILPVSATFSTAQTNEWRFGSSSTNEISEYAEVGTTLTVEESHSADYSKCEKGKYYAYAYYANFDIFMDVGIKIDGSTNKWTATGARACYGLTKEKPYIAFVSSADGNFDVPATVEISKLEMSNYINSDDVFFEGGGTAAEPYKIYSAPQILYIGLMPSKYFRLENDVDLSGWQWVNNITFSGSLDGNGKKITGLKLEYEGAEIATSRYYGLFSRTGSTATIKNLAMEGCTIKVSASAQSHAGAGFIHAGILAGSGGGTFTDIELRNSSIEIWRSKSTSGGIAGVFNGTMTNCKGLGVTMKGNGDMGILAGKLDNGVLKNCTVGSYRLSELSDKLSRIEYDCVNESRSVGGMAGFMTAKSGSDSYEKENMAIISGGSVSVEFAFSGGGSGFNPQAGYVTGDLQGEIEDVKVVFQNKLTNAMVYGFVRSFDADTGFKYLFDLGEERWALVMASIALGYGSSAYGGYYEMGAGTNHWAID